MQDHENKNYLPCWENREQLRERQHKAFVQASYKERLLWLEEVLAMAHAAGGLERYRKEKG